MRGRASLELLRGSEEGEASSGPQARSCAEGSTIVEVVSGAADTDKLGVGSSPYLGDYSGSGVLVPQIATTGPTNRYLIRLCGFPIPYGESVRIRGLRTLATIRAAFEDPLGEAGIGNTYFHELEITSPLWSFLDGNISWHLRWQSRRSNIYRWAAGQLPGSSVNFNGFDSAILYDTLLEPYTAPGQGLPPGRDVPGLGTLRDGRYPWDNMGLTLDEVIKGPGSVVLYASVRQTNPETRFRPPPVADPGALRPEDRFLQAYPTNTFYGHVCGAITYERLV